MYDKKISDLAQEFGTLAFPIEFLKIAESLTIPQGLNIFFERMAGEDPNYDMHISDQHPYAFTNDYLLDHVELGDILDPLSRSSTPLDDVLSLNILKKEQIPHFKAFLEFFEDYEFYMI